MKRTFSSASLGLATLGVLALGACQNGEGTPASSKAQTQTAPQNVAAPAANASSATSDEALPALESQADADAKAEKSINSSNADAELDKLEKEIDGGH